MLCCENRMPRGEKSTKCGKEEKVLEGVENAKSAFSDEAWTPSELLHEPPLLQVTQPKGSFCTIDTRFAVALDPDGVFDILADPNNHRVFKNIKVWTALIICSTLLDYFLNCFLDSLVLGEQQALSISGPKACYILRNPFSFALQTAQNLFDETFM